MFPGLLYIELLKTEFRERFRHTQLGMIGPWLIKGMIVFTIYQSVFFVMLWLLKGGSSNQKIAAVGIFATLALELLIRIIFAPPAFLPYNNLLVMGMKRKILAAYWVFRSLFKSEAILGWICICLLYFLLQLRFAIASGPDFLLHSFLFLLLQLMVLLSRVLGAVGRWIYWLAIGLSVTILYGLAQLLLLTETMNWITTHWEWIPGALVMPVLLIRLIIRLLVGYVLFEN